MEIIDGQLHEFGPTLLWPDADSAQRDAVLEELTYCSMAAAGVHGAVLHPTGPMAWACNLARRHPHRFVVVPMLTSLDMHGSSDMVHPGRADLEERIVGIMHRPGVSALRVVPASPSAAMAAVSPLGADEEELLARGGYDSSFAICQRLGIPVFLAFGGHVEWIQRIADSFPELAIVIDHMGVAGPPHAHAPWWRSIPVTVELARYENVHVKLSSAPVFSRQAFPFRDVWPQLMDLVQAFGSRRLMWGSDISRFQGRMGWTLRNRAFEGDYPGRHTYAESLGLITEADWLTADQKIDVLGRTARRILRWPAMTSPPLKDIP